MDGSSVCHSCKARLRWALTVHGKRMPLDYEPSLVGNVLLQTGQAVVLAGVELEAARSLSQPLYTSHFYTCPSAKKHRNRRTGG